MRNIFFLMTFGFMTVPAHATDLPRGIVYEGYLTDINDNPINGTVNLYFELIGDTGGTVCRLMTETHNTVLVTKGQMSVVIGRGASRSIPGGASVWELYGPIPVSGIDDSNNSCSFDPSVANAKRFFRVSVDGTFTGTVELDHAPMAMTADYAAKVGQHGVSSLLRVENSGTPAAAAPLTSANFTELMNVIAGTSSLYEHNGKLNGLVVPSLSAGQVLGWSGTSWLAITPITAEADPTVQSFAKMALPICSGGTFLSSDGTAINCVSSAITGSSITSGTIGGSTNFDSTGYLKAPVVQTNNLSIFKSGGANSISLSAPASLSANYTLTLPQGLGLVNQLLTTDGMGNLSWVYPPYVTNGGVSLGSNITIGTNDPYSLNLRAGGSDRLIIAPSGGVSVMSGMSISNGLSVGGGISVASGQITGAYSTTGTSSLDWNNGNTLVLSTDCLASLAMVNFASGTQHTLIVTGSGPSQCSFSSTASGNEAGSLVYRWSTPNGSRAASSHTIYRFHRVGNLVYVDWTTGY